jgi:hypothetical protein
MRVGIVSMIFRSLASELRISSEAFLMLPAIRFAQPFQNVS